MSYQLLINNNPVITGDIGIAIFVSILVLGAIVVLINYIWKKLRESEKMKYEFVTIIAHKFRTPLTQIKWLLENLVSSEQDSYKRENIQEMQKANEELIEMTGSLVEITDSDAASASEYSLEKVDLREFVRTVSDRFKDTFHRKNLFFSVRGSNVEVFAKIDRSRMGFVLETIIENAISYSPPGRNVELSITGAKGKAVISVKDDGIGMDPKDRGRIFSKFFRGKNAQNVDTEGFGIGLYLASSVVKRHHGKIDFFSEGLNKGSTVSIILPALRN